MAAAAWVLAFTIQSSAERIRIMGQNKVGSVPLVYSQCFEDLKCRALSLPNVLATIH
jgi:hypothetical protein